MRSNFLGVFTKLVSFQTATSCSRVTVAFQRPLLLPLTQRSLFHTTARGSTTTSSSSTSSSSSSDPMEAVSKKTQQQRRRNNNSARPSAVEGGPISKRPKTTTSGIKASNQICRDFQKSGSCDFGDKCRYMHTATFPAPIDEESIETAITVDTSISTTEEGNPSSLMKFANLNISVETKKSIRKVFNYETMTQVQAETLPVILNGTDCLAKAKTGTGKTLAFLIPAVELLIKSKEQPKHFDIGCLILSPTRELAFQIHKEAEELTRFHKIKTMVCVGGTNISKDKTALKASIQILVATPGRLLDHLLNGGVARRLANMKVLIMDEADQLLDMGFRPDIEKILKLLEPSKVQRQTLLFSATVPKSVADIARIALKPSYTLIDTVGIEVEQTHSRVKQELVVVSQAQIVHAIEALLSVETPADKPFKVIVFFTTARLTGFMADLFNSVKSELGYSTMEIHSRMSQPSRLKASETFRHSTRAVLFSSDVSARGMDYPDVTYVLQVGLTERSQYIHRLGRTARAGKEGKGCLLLAPYEEQWMTKQLKDMPLQKVNTPTVARPCMDNALRNVSRDKELNFSAQQAYRAWLGFYNASNKKFNWDKAELVVHANQWAKDVGLREQPGIEAKTVGKMGLKGVRGLKLE